MGRTSSTQNTMGKFFSQFPQESFLKGTTLIAPKQSVKHIYYIEQGIVRSYLISSKGTDVTINFFEKGSFVPMAWVMNQIESTYYLEAFTDIVARVAPSKKVIEFLQQNPRIMYDLLKRVYKGMEGILLHKEFLVEGNAQCKLTYAIITLARKFGILKMNKSTEIPFDIDENKIASLAGLARETVSRELQKLQKIGIVTYEKKRLTINNMLLLEEIIQNVINTF